MRTSGVIHTPSGLEEEHNEATAQRVAALISKAMQKPVTVTKLVMADETVIFFWQVDCDPAPGAPGIPRQRNP